MLTRCWDQRYGEACLLRGLYGEDEKLAFLSSSLSFKWMNVYGWIFPNSSCILSLDTRAKRSISLPICTLHHRFTLRSFLCLNLRKFFDNNCQMLSEIIRIKCSVNKTKNNFTFLNTHIYLFSKYLVNITKHNNIIRLIIY